MKRKRAEVNGEDEEGMDDVVLIKPNIILFYADVSPKSVSKLHKIIIELENMKTNDITIYIQTDGGCFFSGVTAHDFLKRSTMKIRTIITGHCASAGTLIAIAGDERYATENSTYMIHSISTEHYGNVKSMQVDMTNLNMCDKIMVRMYSKSTGLARSAVRAMIATDTYFTAKKALKHKFINGIL